MSSWSASAVAHPNIALAKYWGKREGGGNFPAVPSLSVTLAGMSTRTTVAFRDGLLQDEVSLNGVRIEPEGARRAVALLERVREHAGLRMHATVDSHNDFPTASGLASSASGFAALALAAVTAANLEWDASKISDLARRASASAARSLFGGYVEMAAGEETPDASATLAASPVLPADALDLSVLVCVTSELAKDVHSTEGMNATRTSAYYRAWLDAAPRVYSDVRKALLASDFEALGAAAEESAYLMHAAAMGAGIVYFNGASVALMRAVKAARREGISAYVTMDAGPHVKVLVQRETLPVIREQLATVPGLLRFIEAAPGPGARLV